MRLQVEFQIRQFTELFTTFSATVRFLSSMYQHVISQVSLLMETLITDFANEIFLIGVNLHVGLQS